MERCGATTLVTSLSAGRVLAGIGVTLLLYAMIARRACIRGAVSRASRALERLRRANSPVNAAPLAAPLIASMRKPFEAVRGELVDVTDRLEHMSRRGECAMISP